MIDWRLQRDTPVRVVDGPFKGAAGVVDDVTEMGASVRFAPGEVVAFYEHGQLVPTEEAHRIFAIGLALSEIAGLLQDESGMEKAVENIVHAVAQMRLAQLRKEK